MGFEAGGYAAKLGNRYEGKWVIRQLFQLLHERIASVTIEPVGDDEEGVDLWVEHLNGSRNAQQCKALNGTKPHWSFADLHSRGVLKKSRNQLHRNPRNTFTFVSSVPATSLADLSRSARDSSGDARHFYENQIVNRSEDARKEFKRYCGYLELNQDDSDDLEIAFDLLCRSDFHSFADDRHTREDLTFKAQISAIGNPEHIVNALAEYAESNLRRSITTADLCHELNRVGLPLRKLAADDRTSVRILDLNSEFSESIKPLLAAQQLIFRPETRSLHDLICKESSVDSVIIHGDAGHGKSGVIYEFSQQLASQGIPYLAIRLDRRFPNGSARRFGKDLDLLESPTICLNSIAAGEPSVLILDQLDALRWTGTNAAQGLDVCKEILREVSALRKTGSNLKVVFCCRTFDLEHDPQISSWIKSQPHLKIERVSVGPLAESTVQEIAGKFGFDFQRFSTQQQKLLTTVSNLAIWVEIVQSEQLSPDFGSQTQLLRLYWNTRFQLIEQRGISGVETRQLLDKLVGHMEQTAVPSAPKRLLEQHQKLSTELQSLGVLRVSGNRVSFAHQTHLDFQIAEGVMVKLDTANASVIEWLGNRSQMSLFRREQLRQLLMLLADENPRRFLQTVQLVLESSSVRFHLKQLALEVVGKVEPTNEVFGLIVGLLSDNDWRSHIEGEVLFPNSHFFDRLAKDGTLQQWLDSDCEEDKSRALWMMRIHREEFEEVVATLCLPLISRGGEWPKHVQNVLSQDCKTESDTLFELRLLCARIGATLMYIEWKGFVKAHPRRALRLFESILEHDFDGDDNSVRTRHYNNREDPSLNALVEAAKQYPEFSVELLLPWFKKYVRRSFEAVRELRQAGRRCYAIFKDQNRTPASLSQTLLAAFANLARTKPNRFLELTPQLEELPGRLTRLILVRAFTWLSREHSDTAISWLLSDDRRLKCGKQQDSPRWKPARNLIQVHSRHCSPDVFESLQQFLLAYFDPDEIRHSKFNITGVRRGYFGNIVGNAQHYLLPALDKTQLSSAAIGRIGVWQEKFGPHNENILNESRSMGGMVRSPISRSNASRMSDSAWLRLIENENVPASGRSGLRYFPEGAIDTSVSQFSRDLRIAAFHNPERFARLALSISSSAPTAYFSAILEAVACTSPPNEPAQENQESWKPASAATVDAMLAIELDFDDPEMCKKFCMIIRNRDDITLTDEIIERLKRCARHANPGPAELCVSTSSIEECSINDLDIYAINSVRGVVAGVIAHVLFDRAELLPRFRTTIEALIVDANPSVRLAATQVCLPIWNIDQNLSVELFVRAASEDVRVGACRYARRMFNICIPKFQDQVAPIIREMAHSQIAEISEFGSGEVVARWVFHDIFGIEVDEVLNGTVAQKKGAVEALVDIADQPGCSAKCFNALLPLANDENEDVRQSFAKLFYGKEIVEQAGFAGFMQCYVKTRAFAANPADAIEVIQKHATSLTQHSELILLVSNAFLRTWESSASSPDTHRWGASRNFMPLMQRLYEQAISEDLDELRDQCLDFWDEMLRLRICSGTQLSTTISS